MRATSTEVRRCNICRRRLTQQRELEGLKTCSGRCTRRWKRWKDPDETRLAQLIAATGEDRVVWNNEALRSKLGLARQATGERLLQLARSRGWEVAWDRRGYVRATAPVPLDRRKYLVQREVIPDEVPR